MKKLNHPLCLLLALFCLVPAARAQDIPQIEYEQFVLDNGLTLIVHEDRKAPIVAVNVWYHVGSKNEPKGRSGFAHLFEHLMFNGSENHDDDYFQPLERVGATDLNGTTNWDRTNYFQNVPTGALDMVLFLESDRMGHMLGAVTQEKLDEQRGVVQNEKRQSENQPYGQVYNRLTYAMWPERHPYAHTVIGEMEDLDAAELADVHEWFRTYYGPNNAVIVVAGDIDPQTALAKVEQYFGDIPPGPPIPKFERWIPQRTGEQREVLEDRVPQARIYKTWVAPEWGSADADFLDIAASVLSTGRNSRLYRRLVHEEELATSVFAYNQAGEIAGLFNVVATARPGVDLRELERVLDEELARFLDEGPTEEELELTRARQRASFVRGVERIGGFGGKSDILAMNAVYAGDPSFYRVTMQRKLNATANQIHETARNWLSDGVHVIEVRPYPQLQATGAGVDRSELPDAGAPSAADFPDIQETTLSNGMKVVLAERATVPLVEMRLLVDAGYAADQFATPGTAALTMEMLDEGTENYTGFEISERLDLLGAQLSSSAGLDVATVRMSALKDNLDESIDLFAEVVLRPAFDEADFERLQRQQLAQIQQEKSQPLTMGLRVLPGLIYGEGHAYSLPYTGSGYEHTVAALTRDDLVNFHQTWFRPNNSVLVVAGDITLNEVVPMLEAQFAGWQRGDVPQKNVGAPAGVDHPVVYVMDRPGAQQSIIFAANAAPPKSNPHETAIEAFNRVLGGSFTSRINMNLREDKGWSYGARSLVLDAAGPRFFLAYAPVQSDKTAESVAEMHRELTEVLGDRPLSTDELSRAQNGLTLTLPGRWETLTSVAGSVTEIVQYDLPHDYYDTYEQAVRSLTLNDVHAAGPQFVRPDNLVWVVVGDRALVEQGLRDLGIGDIRYIDGDGMPITAAN